MLEVKNLNLTIEMKTILSNISFLLKENKITVLIGKNGSGKSSIVKSINGITKYTGNIILNNQNILCNWSMFPQKGLRCEFHLMLQHS